MSVQLKTSLIFIRFVCVQAQSELQTDRSEETGTKRFLHFLDTMATGVLHELCVCIASADMEVIGVKEP
jgi:hypothetical protein